MYLGVVVCRLLAGHQLPPSQLHEQVLEGEVGPQPLQEVVLQPVQQSLLAIGIQCSAPLLLRIRLDLGLFAGYGLLFTADPGSEIRSCPSQARFRYFFSIHIPLRPILFDNMWTKLQLFGWLVVFLTHHRTLPYPVRFRSGPSEDCLRKQPEMDRMCNWTTVCIS